MIIEQAIGRYLPSREFSQRSEYGLWRELNNLSRQNDRPDAAKLKHRIRYGEEHDGYMLMCRACKILQVIFEEKEAIKVVENHSRVYRESERRKHGRQHVSGVEIGYCRVKKYRKNTNRVKDRWPIEGYKLGKI